MNKFFAFLADTKASYAPMFGLLIVPVLGTVGASIEYTELQQTRSSLQDALDSSALATAKELSVTMDTDYLSAYSRNFFDANLDTIIEPDKVGFTFTSSQQQVGGTRVLLTATYTKKTHFGAFIGVEEFPLTITSEVAAGNRTAEIAIVMDNSGSMHRSTGSSGSSRISQARLAAVDLVNSLHSIAALSNKPDPVRISVVPFGGSVNVGSQYRGADWLDMNGWSSTHHENLDWLGSNTNGDSWSGAYSSSDGYRSASTTTNSVGPNPPDPLPSGITAYDSTWLTRWTLFDTLDTGWAGCIEMRPDTFNTTDTAPDDMTPDTLFVPMFAPDEPNYRSYEDDDYRNNYLDDYARPGPDYPKTSANSGNYTRQIRRQSWTAKYNSGAAWTDYDDYRRSYNDRLGYNRSRDMGDWGPNQGCTTDPLLPLTANKQSAIDSIQAMDAGGYTNVQAGLVWGWRTLSSGSPFTQGRAYSVPENDKYIIILTDGNNTYPGQSTRNETEYYAWGYGRDERVLEGLGGWESNTAAMNIKTKNTCDNIKTIIDADNESAIKIFTIAYDVADGSSVKDLLYDCASVGRDGKKYYYDVSGDAIADTMAAIGNEISELRIAR